MTKYYQVTCGEYTINRYFRTEEAALAVAERKTALSKRLALWVVKSVWLDDDSTDDDRPYHWKG